MEHQDKIVGDHPEFHDVYDYFTMSGTSQVAGVVTGIVALVLQADPTLTPDDVKCRLMASAHPAVKADGTLAYSVFQQGAGLVNAYDAVFKPVVGCANSNLDISQDLAGTEHYAGYARRYENGESYIEGLEGSSMLWGEADVAATSSVAINAWVEQE